MDSHSAYVEMTRHRDGAEIYWSKDEFKDYDDMVRVLSRERDKDLVQDYISPEISYEFEKASFALHRGLDTLWETFWEKYGREWLEKIQHTLSTWADNTKELVETIKEQATKTLNLNFLDKEEESWLKETRAWMEATFGKDEGISKDERLNNNAADQPTSLQEINPVLSHKKEVTEASPLSDEERYQNIMKDAEMWETRLEVERLLKYYEQDHSSPEKVEKNIEKNLDKEIDF